MTSRLLFAPFVQSGSRILSTLRIGFSLGLFSLVAGEAAGAASATLTPNSTSSVSATPVVLQVTGLTSGDAVIVERFADANADGVIDAGEFLAEAFTVTDGQVTSIGGVRNTNIPGDEDAAADGQITTHLRPAGGPEMGRFAGAQIIRVSSPTAAFTAFTRTLTITQPVEAQSITGSVTDGSNPVPYAGVMLFDVTTDGELSVGVVADANGQFTVAAPVGSYIVVAFKPGFVSSFDTAPVVSLGAGAALTQNLLVAAATTSISGTVADAGTSAGLGGVQLFMESQTGQIVIISTNLNGTYSVPVTPGQWQIETGEISLRQLGYLSLDGGNGGVTADTTGGAATGVNIDVPKATALIHGTVTDSDANPLAGIQVGANDSNHTYFSDATTDANGHYVLGVTTGSWNAFVSNDSPGLAGYLVPDGQQVTITGAQAVLADFSLLAVNAHLQGIVTNNSTPVAGIQVGAYNQGNNQFITTPTAPDGTFDLGLVAGTWSVQIESTSAANFNILSPSVNHTLSANQTITGVAIAVISATTQINGSVKNTQNNPISGVQVYGNATIGGSEYSNSATTDGSGNYSFPVAAGIWNVSASNDDLQAQGYLAPSDQTANVSSNPVTLHFVAQSFNAHLQGVVTNNGSPVSGIRLGAFNQSANQFLTAETAPDGTFDLGLLAGTWSVQIESSSAAAFNIVSPSVEFTLTENQTISGITFAIQSATAQINGYVRDGSNQPLNATVYATATISGVMYAVNAQTNGSGDYVLPVIDGTWQVGAFANDFTNPNPLTAIISGSNATRNFTLTKAPVISSQPTDQTVNAGQTLVFAINANSNAPLSFQWQVSSDGGSNWGDLANGSTYNNVTSSVLGVTANAGLNGYRYRCIATNSFGSASSNHALLTVNVTDVAPSITAQPTNQTVNAGQNATFTVAADGTPVPTLQWQVSTDGGSNWNDLTNAAPYSGVTLATLTVTTTSGLSGYRYRALATSTAGSASSNAALLTVNVPDVAPSITAHPANQTVNAGENAAFTVAADGSPAPAFQWQVSTDGGFVWNSLTNTAPYSGVTLATLTVTTNSGLNSYRYRALATNTAGSAPSNSALLTVNVPNVAPSITAHPADRTVTAGENATFTVAANGTPTPTLQWQVSTDSGSNWSNLGNDATYSGVDASTLTVTAAIIGQSGYRYRAVATNTAGSAPSNEAVLTVNAPAFSILHRFTYASDGASPAAGMILSGNTLYGTAVSGGSSGHGTVFKVNTDGTGFTALHDFTTIAGGYAGGEPSGELVLAGNTLYGTTVNGGTSGYGTVFKVNIDGTGFTTLHSFGFAEAHPSGALIISGSTLYGTTRGASGPGQGGSSFGTVFAINTDGSGFTNIHSFPTPSGSYPDYINSGGIYPSAGLILSGNILYGVASFGGSFANGTVFALNTDGSGFITLHHFPAFGPAGSNSDGAHPQGRLVLAGSTLYGTAFGGGTAGAGTVFTLNTNGTGFANLHSFDWYTEGGQPRAGVVLAGSTLYGTATGGGSSSYGTVFAVNIDGTGFTTKHAFTGGSGGQTPEAGLVLSENSLYGATYAGGTPGQGTVFRLLLGGGSPVDAWRLQYFGSSINSGDGADTATPDDDGIPNLVKYGLVITPGSSGASALLPAQPRTYAEGNRLALIFTRDPSRYDVTLEVQTAGSAAGPWTTVATSTNGGAFTGPGFVGEANAGGGLMTVEVRDTVNMSAAPYRFMHIKVTR